MSRLDDILEAVRIGVSANSRSKTPQIAKQAIKDLMLSIIGEDWPLDKDLPYQQQHNRQVLNGQLFELRKAVESL